MTGAAGIPPPLAGGWPPDPIDSPHSYEGVTARRVLAWFLDMMIVSMLILVLHLAIGMATVLTFGLLWPLHLLVVPLGVVLAYHIVQFATPAAGTLGMRLFGLRAWSVLGGRPQAMQAIVHGFCFYGSMAVTGGLVALVALFNGRRQTLHDFLAGIVVLREAG